MRKRILLVMTALLLVLGTTALTVFAAGSGNVLCKDGAGCITEEQQQTLEDKLTEITDRQECEVVICTTTDFKGKSSTAYADDYFDYNGYGFGSNKDGILLLINTESRDWAISTHGYGITAFTDAGQKYLIEQIKPALGNDDYAGAFEQFADLCDDFLTQAHTGTPYDNGNLPKPEKSINIILDVLAGLVIGFIVAFIIVSRDKSALKTVRREAAARNYMRPRSLKLTARHEQFMYSHVDRTEKQSSSGSSTHTSSSGETHGGSSGKF